MRRIFIFRSGDERYPAALLDLRENVYVTPEYIVAPIFSYEQRKNVMAESISNEESSVAYTELKENEFFAASQQGMNMLIELKNQLLQKYPAS